MRKDPPSRTILGIGAQVKIRQRLLHPHNVTRGVVAGGNPITKYVKGTVTGKGMERMNGKDQEVIYIRTDDARLNRPHVTLYACSRFFTITKEGPAEGFFHRRNIQDVPDEPDDAVHQAIVERNDSEPGVSVPPLMNPSNGASQHHELLTLPKQRKFHLTRMVHSKGDYAQRKCVGCPKKVRTYCLCSPGVMRCANCYGDHRAYCAIIVRDDSNVRHHRPG